MAVPRQAAPTAPEDSTKGRLHSPTAIHAPEDITALQAPQATIPVLVDTTALQALQAITSAPQGK